MITIEKILETCEVIMPEQKYYPEPSEESIKRFPEEIYIRLSDIQKMFNRKEGVDIQKDIELICFCLDFNYHELKCKSRDSDLVLKRMVIFNRLFNLGYKKIDIGTAFNRDHSTVVFSIQQYAKLMKFPVDKIEAYNKIKEWEAKL